MMMILIMIMMMLTVMIIVLFMMIPTFIQLRGESLVGCIWYATLVVQDLT